MLSQLLPAEAHLGMTYTRTTHDRSQRFGGHTKHTFYCSCGRRVSGNGGKQHFKRDGHTWISFAKWREVGSA